MSLVTYECCLCNEPIEDGSHTLDPCGLVIYANIDKDINDDREQLFFVHFLCWKAAMDSGTRVHLVLEDQVAE